MAKAACDPTKPLWSIMTKSQGGTVSVIRDLTLDQVRKTYERLSPWYGYSDISCRVHKDYVKPDNTDLFIGGSSFGRNGSDSDIVLREVFGPPGWDGFKPGEVEQWPKVDIVWTDEKGEILPDEFQDDTLSAARERQRRKMRAASDKLMAEMKGRNDIERRNAAAPDSSGPFGWPWFS